MGGRYEREFLGSGEPLSRGRDLPPKETGPLRIDVLAVVSESHRRKTAVEDIVGIPVITVPGGPEDQLADPIDIAKQKLNFGRMLLRERGVIRPNQTIGMVAADVISRPMGTNRYDVVVAKRTLKPRDPRDILGIFEELSHTYHNSSTNKKTDPFYLIEAGSGFESHPGNPNENAYVPGITTVTLDPRMVDFFATDEGFNRYVQEFNHFHQSEIYLNNGRHTPVDITSAAGGLSIPVFMRLGAIKDVDHAPIEAPEFEERLAHASYMSLVGIHPAVLKNLRPDAEQRIRSLPWISTVTDYAMGRINVQA